MKHLDSLYRKRYQLYQIDEKTIFDSRNINWRDVPWEKINKITTYMNNKIYITEKPKDSNFKCFMCFRWAGREAIYKEDKTFSHHAPINIWTIGYTDGIKCFLSDIDFFTGNKIKEYILSLNDIRAHIHPRINIEKIIVN